MFSVKDGEKQNYDGNRKKEIQPSLGIESSWEAY